MGGSEGHILVVDDDDTIALAVTRALEAQQFRVERVDNGEDALAAVAQALPRAIILDVMLPGMNGLDVLRRLKAEHPHLPILLLTAQSDEIDRVLGLELGADDYVPKPFSVRELVARVRTRLRNASQEPMPVTEVEACFRFGKNEVDLRKRVLVRDGVEQRLTTHEAGVLGYLIAHRSQTVTREDLLAEVWGYSPTMVTRTVDNQILKLRKRVEDSPAEPKHILTVHGAGYRFEV